MQIPSRPTSAGVVKAIVDEFISRVEEGTHQRHDIHCAVDVKRSFESTECGKRSAQIISRMSMQSESTAITLKTNKEGAAGGRVRHPCLYGARHGIDVFDVHRFLWRTLHPGRTLTGDFATSACLTHIHLRRFWAEKCWESSSRASHRLGF